MKDYSGKSVFANYFRSIEAVGGKVFFDDKGLTFKSHVVNIQTGTTRIEYEEIDHIELGPLSTSILIFTKDGKKHHFIMYHRKKIIEFLNSKCKQCNLYE